MHQNRLAFAVCSLWATFCVQTFRFAPNYLTGPGVAHGMHQNNLIHKIEQLGPCRRHCASTHTDLHPNNLAGPSVAHGMHQSNLTFVLCSIWATLRTQTFRLAPEQSDFCHLPHLGDILHPNIPICTQTIGFWPNATSGKHSDLKHSNLHPNNLIFSICPIWATLCTQTRSLAPKQSDFCRLPHLGDILHPNIPICNQIV